MNFSVANVADILRCSQRDNFVIEKLQSYVSDLLKIFTKKYHRQDNVQKIANIIYYYLTSLSDLQTLGEEYTGTIRFNLNAKKPPTKLAHLLWLVFLIGGDTAFNSAVSKAENSILKSKSLTKEAKNLLLKTIQFLKTNKHIFIRFHTALFYIWGDHYHISNRLLGIRYILLRHWFQDNTYTQNFKILGYVLLFYLIIHSIKQFKSIENEDQLQMEVKGINQVETNSNFCLVCSENIKNITVTFCGHLFCWDCIQESLKFQQVCPICREQISTNKIIYLQNYS